jgi:hypothetical protein
MEEEEAAELRQRLEMQAGSAFSTTKPCGFPYMHMTDGACSSVSSPFFPGLDDRWSASAECQVWCEVDPGVRLGRGQVGP